MAVRQYIGARYVPRFYENSLGTAEWQPNVAYEPLTIVTYNGNSYTSKKDVPANIGDPSNNPTYWASTGIYNQQIDQYRQEVADLSDQFEEETAEINSEIAKTNKRVGNLAINFNGEKVVGHAGASGLAPANTIAGFLLAANLKADAIEGDVQITADHVPVCYHNDTVNGYVIRETNSSVILAQTVTGNYSEKFSEQTIPTYEQFVQICKNAGVECITEIKWEGQHITTEELPLILNILKKYDMLQNTVFISWYEEPLAALLNIDNTLKCMPLYGLYDPITEANISHCAEAGFYGVGMARSSNVSMIAYAHSLGLRTNVFTLEKNDSVIHPFLVAGCDYLTSGYIIDVGARNNPYTSGSGTRTTAIFSRYGQAVMHKFFETCPPDFPTFNTTTSRFSTVEAEKRMPARISEILSNYATFVKNVAPGQTVNTYIPNGYRMTALFYKANGDYISGTAWITAEGLHTETVPANAYIAVISYQKGEGEFLDYWNLADIAYAVSVS